MPQNFGKEFEVEKIDDPLKEHIGTENISKVRVYPLTQETIDHYQLHEGLRPSDLDAEANFFAKELQRCQEGMFLRYLYTYFGMTHTNNKFYTIDWHQKTIRVFTVEHAFPCLFISQSVIKKYSRRLTAAEITNWVIKMTEKFANHAEKIGD